MEIDVSEIKDYEEYAYALGVLKSRENKIISKKHMMELAGVADLDALLKGLSDTGYGPYLNRANTPLEYELAVEKALAEEISEARSLLSPKKHWVIDVFLLKYDFFNLKIFLRAKLFGRKLQAQSFSVLGSITPEEFVSLLEKEDEETMKFFEEKGLGYVVGNALTIFKKSNDIVRVDNYIDKAMFSKILEMIPRDVEGNFFRNYWKVVIDSFNLLSYLRLKREGRESSFKDYFIHGGNLEVSDFEEFSIGKSPVAELWDSVKDEFEKSSSLTMFEMRMRAYLQKFAKETKLLKSMAPETVAGYLLEKEHEAQNIRLIIALKEKGVDPKIIEKLVSDSYA